MKSPTWKPASHLTWTEREGETVVVDSQEGKIYRFNGVGAAVWSLLQSSKDEIQMASEIAASFEAPLHKIQKDISAFLSQLRSQDLIERVETSHV